MNADVLLIPTNVDIQRFSSNILFNEKIGGPDPMTFGADTPDNGSTSR